MVLTDGMLVLEDEMCVLSHKIRFPVRSDDYAIRNDELVILNANNNTKLNFGNQEWTLRLTKGCVSYRM